MADSTKTTSSFSLDSGIKDLFGVSTGFTNSQFGTIGSSLAGFGSSLTGYAAKEASAKAQKAFQNYSNTMLDLSNAVSQDTITMNEIQYIDASAQKSTAIKKQGMAAVGALEASAGAAGVRGNSVLVQNTHAVGEAAAAEATRQREFKYAMLGFDSQRLNSAMSAAMNKNYSTYAGGSLADVAFSGLSSVSSIIGAF